MSFRSRLLLACVPLTVVPVALVAVGVRREVNERVRAQYDARVDGMARVIEDDLERESRAIKERLASLSEMLADDNRLRLQLLGADVGDRRYLLDYAGDAMRLAGLDMLQLQDENGRILSSGHFRNDFDRADPGIVEALRAASGRAVASVRTAGRTFPALVHVADVRIGASSFSLVGGTALDRSFLSSLDRGAGLSIALEYPGADGRGPVAPAGEGRERGAPSATEPLPSAGGGRERGGRPATALVREIELPFVTRSPSPRSSESAALVITQSLEPLRELRRSIDRWFLTVTASAAVVALLLASWAASRLSRPVTELARRMRRLDLDRLDVDFRSKRRDRGPRATHVAWGEGRGPRATHVAWGEGEVGTLARTLDALTDRLRASVSRLRDAERRAAIGDIARQVNHDVRNGLTPIRNVVHHLAEVARHSPAELPGVFLDRQRTLDASVDYLRSLAGNYARLSPRLERRACDVAASVRELLNGLPDADRLRVRATVGANLPPVNADPIALRRILENIVTNALDSLEPNRGHVTISAHDASAEETTETATGNGEHENTRAAHGSQTVRVVIADNGHGMTRDGMSRMFDDFYTTKERGTGLGLSIVRRLINDLGARLAVDSEVGKGTRFTIDLPADGARSEPVEAPSPEAQLATRTSQLETPPPRRTAAES